MILKMERLLPKITKTAPKVGEPWKEGNPVGDCIAGYRKEPKNPYIEKLMQNQESEK